MGLKLVLTNDQAEQVEFPLKPLTNLILVWILNYWQEELISEQPSICVCNWFAW